MTDEEYENLRNQMTEEEFHTLIDLCRKLQVSERERARNEIARIENVDIEFVTGDTEDEMRASAIIYLATRGPIVDLQSSAAPASEITSNGKVEGPHHLTSKDELQTMTPTQIVDSYRDGLLDEIL